MKRTPLTTTLVIILVLGATCAVAATASGGAAAGAVPPPLAQALPVWEQVNSSGFGASSATAVSALGAFGAYLYAGTHDATAGARIFRSHDGAGWSPVTQPGFGIAHDIAPPAILDFEAFDGQLYASTGRGDGPAQIWRSLDGLAWAPMVIHGFSDPDSVTISALAVYDGALYAGVGNLMSGAQVWRSFTGDNNTWTRVAPAVPGTAPASVAALAELDGALYALVESEGPVALWRGYGADWAAVMEDGFGSNGTTSAGGMATFGGALYVGVGNAASGAQLWRSADGTSWQPAVIAGFGDANNTLVEVVYVFQSQLYVGVKNTTTGLQLWRSGDGTNWERANQGGFGDSGNTGSNRSSAAANFLGQLYVGTSNSFDGGEIWRMRSDGADLALSEVDTSDPVELGASFRYTLTVSNAGPGVARAVVLTDTLPPEVSYLAATPDQGTCIHSAGAVTCFLGDIATGGSHVVQLTVVAERVAVLDNRAVVTSDTPDDNPGNNACSEKTTIRAPAATTHLVYLPLITK